ncbi:MAG: radical SAM protein [Candidatus Marinimicrobia bacterium]|nr:radical SAM protein [Candidatus Neomarinimicrobiota bacterium]
MKIIATSGNPDIAIVYLADLGEERLIEFVEAVQPSLSRKEKWVLIISTLYGCPVGCPICDAGYNYKGRLSEQELLAQIYFLIRKRFPDGKISSKQFKIQFSRMGEPAFNPNVLSLLQNLPSLIDAPGLMPSISTIAPNSTNKFFNELLLVKRTHYNKGNFQLQFSLHSTDTTQRDELIPVKKWSFEKIARYGNKFYQPGDRKITLNFVLTNTTPIDPNILLNHFDPEKYLVKLTPLNPTYRSQKHGLESAIDPYTESTSSPITLELKKAGYEVILSIGEPEENLIGSNCGQYIQAHLRRETVLADGYSYPINMTE